MRASEPGRFSYALADAVDCFFGRILSDQSRAVQMPSSRGSESQPLFCDQRLDEIVAWGLADGNDGKPVASWSFSVCGLIPKGAKNVAIAKDFLKYLIQPGVLNEYLKTGPDTQGLRLRPGNESRLTRMLAIARLI